MIEINLFDSSFSHQQNADGLYSVCDGKIPRYTRYLSGLKSFDGVTIFTDNYIFSDVVDSIESKYKIAWILENRETSPHLYAGLNDEAVQKFDLVLTYDSQLLELYPSKAIFYPFGGCWVGDGRYSLRSKTELLNILYSEKTQAPGHMLRHQIANKFDNLDKFGSGAGQPFQLKEDVLSDYMFTIVVENYKDKYYFSEKLLDAMALGVIPIYWGASAIGDFFDVNGILAFETIEELEQIINNLSEELYVSMISSANINLALVGEFDTPENWIFKNILMKNGMVEQSLVHELESNDPRTTIDGKPQSFWLASYFNDGGDHLLYNMPWLNDSSIIVDVGSYNGGYSVNLNQRYNCYCYGFEPVGSYHTISEANSSEKVKFYNYGLGSEKESLEINVLEDASSFYLESDKKEICEINPFEEVFDIFDSERISLLKINIEGGEYPLMEHILDNGLHKKIDTILVQYHYLGDFPVYRRDKINDTLSNTHKVVFSYPFVWECWRTKDVV
jgi:FkbM family methyltransferase